jgi:small subunit ribosomal protein S6
VRRYETILITEPELPDEQLTGLLGTFTSTITDRQGQVLKTEDWGKKKLAYDVRKHREGRYLRLEYTCADIALPHELERRLRMTEPVIKFLTVRIDNDPRRLVWEAKQEQKERERAARRAAEEAAAPERAEGQEVAQAPEPGAAPVSSPDPAPSLEAPAPDSGGKED